jgi:hypothetical protein
MNNSEKTERTENPVISPKTSWNYLPLSQSVSRNLNSSPDSSLFQIRSPRDLTQMRTDEFSKNENSLLKLVEKSKGFDNFHVTFMNLKPLLRLGMNLNQNDRTAFCKLFRNVLENLSISFEELSKVKTSLKKTGKDLDQEKEKLKDSMIANKSLQSQLNSILHRVNFDKSKLETSNSNEQASRKYLIEREKLLEKIQMLEEHISELKSVTKIEQISSKLENYRNLYEKLSKEYRLYSKEKETHIYKFQQEIGMLKNELSANKDYLANYQIKEQKMENELKRVKEEAENIREKFFESVERLALFREDMVRFFNYKEMFDGAMENLNVWKNKYLQLELNVMSGNLTLNQEGVVWVDLNDPIFAIFRKGACFNLVSQHAQGSSMNRLDYASMSSKGRRKSNFDVAIDLSEINLTELKMIVVCLMKVLLIIGLKPQSEAYTTQSTTSIFSVPQKQAEHLQDFQNLHFPGWVVSQ